MRLASDSFPKVKGLAFPIIMLSNYNSHIVCLGRRVSRTHLEERWVSREVDLIQ